jgi:hypothetical protein
MAPALQAPETAPSQGLKAPVTLVDYSNVRVAELSRVTDALASHRTLRRQGER